VAADDKAKRKRSWKRDVAEDAAEAGGCCLLGAIFSALALLGLAGLPVLLMR
jgi:hypothetical protein